MDKTLISLDKFGNTSSSSVPISMVNKYGNDEKNKVIHTLMCGFGVGLSWSTIDCFVNTKDIFLWYTLTNILMMDTFLTKSKM